MYLINYKNIKFRKKIAESDLIMMKEKKSFLLPKL